MLLILSPAKLLNFIKIKNVDSTDARFAKETKEIMFELAKLSKSEISTLMKTSYRLTDLSYSRFKEWKWPHEKENSKQALFAFSGTVYDALNPISLNTDALNSAQKNIRIISGLYGLLRPMDMIMPYRLEMGASLSVNGSKNLYSYWSDKIAREIQTDMYENGQKVLLNLASNEYSKTVLPFLDKKIKIITCDFREQKADKLQIVSLYAKETRGRMSRFIIENNIENPKYLKAFTEGGYLFRSDLSNNEKYVFVR